MSVDRVEEVRGVGEAVQAEEVATAETGETKEAVTTAAAALHYYAVAPGVRLNVRSGPGTTYGIVRILAEGAMVPIFCQTPGSTVTGPYGTTKIWDNIDSGEYVSDAYVKTGSDGYVAARCA
ncbi:SH3 domain-containing protein [Streptomyces sp. NPDC087903]|uniref:SH3 domain-containing protein n=1 Tax=unclassified Streptomyces TaxID=2593676 RepID=UPI00324733FA